MLLPYFDSRSGSFNGEGWLFAKQVLTRHNAAHSHQAGAHDFDWLLSVSIQNSFTP